MSLIYEPSGRAREYAALACNIYRGCDHGCTYCYAPGVLRMSRENFQSSESRLDFCRNLQREAEKLKPSEPILLCFTCDPYQFLDSQLGVTRRAIEILHNAGHAVQILTKGGGRALRDLDLMGPRDRFATTLTLLDDEASLRWEPGAALPRDRIATIRAFHAAGIPTWVSLEPVLQLETSLEIIRQTHPFVDLYKVGKLNHVQDSSTDWGKFGKAAVALLESLGKEYYIKRDLREAMEARP